MFSSLMAMFLSSMAHGQIISGSVSMFGGSWIFRDNNCGCPPCETSCSYRERDRLDMIWIFVFDPPIGHVLDTPAGVQPLGDVPVDSVQAAPSDGYDDYIGSDRNEELQVNRTYVLRTRDGGHALVRPRVINLDTGAFAFDYKYQPDGSGRFDRVPVQAVTWGGIKTGIGRKPQGAPVSR